METITERLQKGTYEDFIGSLTIKKTIKSPISTLTRSLLSDGFAIIESDEILVNEILMNPRTYSDIRKFKRNTIDYETATELLKQGIMGYIWGATIRVSRKVPDHTILILSIPDYNRATIIKMQKKDNNIITKLQNETTSIKKTLHRVINSLDKIDSTIYDITKTEE